MYPPVLSFVEFLFLINATYHRYLHFNDYFLKWEDDPQVAAMKGKEIAHGEKDKEEYEPIELTKKVFTKQMNVYVFF